MKAIKLTSTLELPREEWLALRRRGIGGSDAGAILGLNPYQSAYGVWCDKLGLTDEQPDSEAMRQGRDFEAYVAQRFCEATGKKVRRCNAMLAHPDHPFLLANVDRLIAGEDAGLECKTASALSRTDYAAGDVPPQHYVQCQHYLAVTGLSRWYLAILVLGRAFYTFEIERDDMEIAALIDAEKAFWEGNVLSNTPPAPDGSPRAKEVLLRRYADEGGSVPLYGMEGDAKEICRLSDEISALERQREAARQRIMEAMGSASEGILPGYKISWRASERTTIDAKRLRADAPDVAEKYSRTTATRTFRLAEDPQVI